MTEKQKEEIKTEAKKILSSFAKSLERVEISASSDANDSEGYREGASMSADDDFRERMFGNAPSRHGDLIIAEKKKW